jgi:hypothetical protein
MREPAQTAFSLWMFGQSNGARRRRSSARKAWQAGVFAIDETPHPCTVHSVSCHVSANLRKRLFHCGCSVWSSAGVTDAPRPSLRFTWQLYVQWGKNCTGTVQSNGARRRRSSARKAWQAGVFAQTAFSLWMFGVEFRRRYGCASPLLKVHMARHATRRVS